MSNDRADCASRSFRIVGLPGDGVGAEVYASACQVLDVLQQRFKLVIERDEQLIGGAAVDATDDPLPEATITACRKADAALLGAVGGPKWDQNPAEKRPEKGLLRIRAEFNCSVICGRLLPTLRYMISHLFDPTAWHRSI